MNIKNTIIEHYRKFFDLHAKGIALDELDHLVLDWAEDLVKNCFMPNVSISSLAEKAKQMTSEALKEIAAKEYDTKCVLEQIEEATQNGAFEIQTYDDKKIRDNLVLLGYNCSEPFKSRDDVYMKVSWS